MGEIPLNAICAHVMMNGWCWFSEAQLFGAGVRQGCPLYTIYGSFAQLHGECMSLRTPVTLVFLCVAHTFAHKPPQLEMEH